MRDKEFIGFGAFLVLCFLIIVGFAVGMAIWGGPTKLERIEILEQRVDDLEDRVELLEPR